MKTYLRTLAFAKPLGWFLTQYVVFALIAVIFSILNLGMLIPLLDVIFEKVPPALSEPTLAFSTSSLKDVLYYQLQEVVNQHGKQGALWLVSGIIVISIIFSNLFTYLSSLILAKIRARVVLSVRKKVFERVTNLHLGYFSNEKKGELISRITNDVQEIEHHLVTSLAAIFKEPISIIGIFVVLFFISAKLTLFSLLLFPISGFIVTEITKRLKRKAVQSQESLGRMVSTLDETLGGIRIIKAFTAVDYIRRKFDDEVDQYSRINMSMARRNELATPLSQVMGVLIMAGILLFGGGMVLDENSTLTGSMFIGYIVLFSQILPPAKVISNSFSSIQRGLVSASRVYEVIDTQPEIVNQSNAIDLDGFKSEIEFENVSFAYEEEKVLENINLTIKKGSTIALVGPSGGGKSTLADLIPRFYDVSSGSVKVDGKSVKEYDINSLRKQMGVVTQESILFNDSVHNNIAFGLPNVKREDVITAAKIANAHEFVNKMEQGYDTSIGERGSKLSGGQRQRLSIARAILKNPPILVLDEATSALDTESEKLVQDALTELMKNRTSIVIAHRLSTIKDADEIIVLQDGQIIERGTHQGLMESGGLYNKLSTMQSIQD